MEEITLTDEQINEAINQAASEGTNSEQEDAEQNVQQEENKQTDDKQKNKGAEKAMKLLAERNALRKEIEEIKSKGINPDTVEKLVQEKVMEMSFYKDYPEASVFSEEIKQMQSEHNLSAQQAYRLIMLDKDPEELAIAKRKAESNPVPASAPPKAKAVSEMSAAELEDKMKEMSKAGKLKL